MLNNYLLIGLLSWYKEIQSQIILFGIELNQIKIIYLNLGPGTRPEFVRAMHKSEGFVSPIYTYRVAAENRIDIWVSPSTDLASNPINK